MHLIFQSAIFSELFFCIRRHRWGCSFTKLEPSIDMKVKKLTIDSCTHFCTDSVQFRDCERKIRERNNSSSAALSSYVTNGGIDGNTSMCSDGRTDGRTDRHRWTNVRTERFVKKRSPKAENITAKSNQLKANSVRRKIFHLVDWNQVEPAPLLLHKLVQPPTRPEDALTV